MCVSIIDREEKPGNRETGEGFKLVKYLGAGEFAAGLIQGCETILPQNKWIRDKGHRILYMLASPARSYRCGFHIFPTMQDLNIFIRDKMWSGHPIVKVKYREVVVVGKQSCGEYGYSNVIVAKEIKRISNDITN